MHALLNHLMTMGAIISGKHTHTEIEIVEKQLCVRLPLEFYDYFTSFRTCKIENDCMWEFFDLPACIDRTLIYRRHYGSIHGHDFAVPIGHVFAFCDALIDAPSYLVVAEPNDSLYGYILGAQGDEGWIVGKNLDDFLCAFKRDWDGAIISNENGA